MFFIVRKLSNTEGIFLEILRAGLWGSGNLDIRIDGTTDWQDIYRLATEQSALGLMLAGLEHFDVKPPQVMLLQWIGEVQVIERQNKVMNAFIAELINKLRENDIYVLLVKGQGIAQCYEKPLWRCSGDVDLFVDVDDYKHAFAFLREIAVLTSKDKAKNRDRLNSEFLLDAWIVELHGTLHANLSGKMDKVIDSVQHEVFTEEKVRVWKNGNVDVKIPAPNEDIIFVFSHILQHFFLGGIGLRQLCDLCRLLWTYRNNIDKDLLHKRLRNMGVVTEWKVFFALMVEHLGLPAEAAPLYESGYEMKAERALSYILEVGNFGHNRDSSYLKEKSSIKRKSNILLHQMKDSLRLAKIFPIDAWRFFLTTVKDGLKNALSNQ